MYKKPLRQIERRPFTEKVKAVRCHMDGAPRAEVCSDFTLAESTFRGWLNDDLVQQTADVTSLLVEWRMKYLAAMKKAETNSCR